MHLEGHKKSAPSFHGTSVVKAHLLSLVFRYESVGKEGYHSLYKWYQAFEAEHFPDPKGLRDTVARWTLHIYPNCIQAAMALFDVPEAIAVSRTQICNAGSIKELSRLQVKATC